MTTRWEIISEVYEQKLHCLRHELKDEIEGVKNTIKDMEKLIEAAWDTIGDIQEEMKANSDVRKQLLTDLDSQKAEIIKVRKKTDEI